jgi:hypothetical protein
MITLFRHVLAIALLPFTVAVLAPICIAQRYGIAVTLGRSVGAVFLQLVGVCLACVGLFLVIAPCGDSQPKGGAPSFHGTRHACSSYMDRIDLYEIQ